METIIKINKGGAAERCGLKEGDEIIAVNGYAVKDLLDLDYAEADSEIAMRIRRDGNEIDVKLVKDESEQYGFAIKDSELRPMRCRNKCKFCFVDQLPKGMRESLYIKDDDYRFSFICGNYVTLTNCGEEELHRMVRLKFSPLYVSVHATNGEIKSFLTANPEGAKTLDKLKYLTEGGIDVNAQIVVCPGINDGKVLEKTINDLYKLGERMKTVACVPVGLTKHREGLYPLKNFDKNGAAEVIDYIEKFNAEHGGNFVYASDEFYIQAGRELPEYEYYGNFEQIENGVGLVREFERELIDELDGIASPITHKVQVTMITGVSFGWFLKSKINQIKEKFPNYDIDVFEVKNEFFGETITVSGLLTAGDIINQCKGKTHNNVIIPDNMLREFSDTFLDGVTVRELEKALGSNVYVSTGGAGAVKILHKLSERKVFKKFITKNLKKY